MYVQPPQEEPRAVQLPQDYSGSAFFAPPSPPADTSTAELPSQEVHVPRMEEAPPEEPTSQGESVPAGAFLHQDTSCREQRQDERRGEHGIFSRFPLLSSFLPPSRGKGGKEKEGGHSELVQWAIIGLAVLLFLEDSTDDLLPLLLLLLLWD